MLVAQRELRLDKNAKHHWQDKDKKKDTDIFTIIKKGENNLLIVDNVIYDVILNARGYNLKKGFNILFFKYKRRYKFTTGLQKILQVVLHWFKNYIVGWHFV